MEAIRTTREVRAPLAEILDWDHLEALLTAALEPSELWIARHYLTDFRLNCRRMTETERFRELCALLRLTVDLPRQLRTELMKEVAVN